MKTGGMLYRIEGLRQFYGSKKVLDIHSFSIEQGKSLGLIGPNGSGKSTLLKLLAFAAAPSSGRIFYRGRQTHPFSPEVRSKVTLLTQTPYLLKRTVLDNVLYGLKIRRDTRNLKARVARALGAVGLDFDQFAPRMWHQLSGGEAQRVAMAARLILKPQVLLLDEPVASVDTHTARLIRKASLKARDEWGTTLVTASHDLSWLFSATDSQISIRHGHLFSTGRQVMLTGPFQHQGSRIIRKLTDGQILILPQASAKTESPGPSGDGSQPEKLAIIKKKNIRLTRISGQSPRTEHQNSENHLIGMVSFLQREKKPGHIMVRLDAADIEFDLSLDTETVSGLGLFPGLQVGIHFSAKDVSWV